MGIRSEISDIDCLRHWWGKSVCFIQKEKKSRVTADESRKKHSLASVSRCCVWIFSDFVALLSTRFNARSSKYKYTYNDLCRVCVCMNTANWELLRRLSAPPMMENWVLSIANRDLFSHTHHRIANYITQRIAVPIVSPSWMPRVAIFRCCHHSASCMRNFQPNCCTPFVAWEQKSEIDRDIVCIRTIWCMDYVRFSFILRTFHTVNYGPRMLFNAYHANQVNPSSNRLVTILFITPRVRCNALCATNISNGIVFQQQQLHIHQRVAKSIPLNETVTQYITTWFCCSPSQKERTKQSNRHKYTDDVFYRNWIK